MSTKTKVPEVARMKGRRLVGRMLREIERVQGREASITGMDPYSLYAEYRYKGEAQDNIVLRYLQRAGAQGDECVAGFCSALSDYCGCIESCGKRDPMVYMRSTERAISEGEGLTREQVLREYELRDREANHRGTALH